MVLFDSAGLLALLGLSVQAFVAWVYFGLLHSLRRKARGFPAWENAFLALAIGLTALVVRFFHVHDRELASTWEEGTAAAALVHAVYLACKGAFATFLLRGCFELSTRSAPHYLRVSLWVLVPGLAASAFLVERFQHLLFLQTPLILVCCFWALWELRQAPDKQTTGVRWVRIALFAMATTWVSHATCALWREQVPWLVSLVSINAFLDVFVVILLGMGLVVTLIEDTHREARLAEEERSRLEVEIERNRRLRSLGTLVSGVAHELNNPLTAILGFASELDNKELAPLASRVIREQAERCHGIVRNLSALSSQTELPRDPIELEDLVDRVLRGLRLRLAEHGQKVQRHSPGPIHLSGDAVGIEQVLANLLVNALQANLLRGQPAHLIEIHLGATDAEVTIDVVDQGPGVPVEARPLLFEPFYTTKRPGDGVGLGLAVARAIVKGHGGRMEVLDAVPGPGARFRVVLPRQKPARAIQVPSPPSRPSAPTRLLIIDDEAAVRRVLRLHAERRGYEVTESERAEPLLDPEEHGRHDIVLCDLRMPGMGGISLHDTLLEIAPDLLPRVVFLTGDLASEESANFASRTHCRLIEKPIDFDELFATLAELAQGQALEKEAP